MKRVIIVMVFISLVLTSCEDKFEEKEEVNQVNMDIDNDAEYKNQVEKGYNLPIDPVSEKQANQDILDIMEKVNNDFSDNHEDGRVDTIIPKSIIEEVVNKLSKEGYIVKTDSIYANIKNEKKFENFLIESQKGNPGEITLYIIRTSGTVSRYKYIYDGKNMYVFATAMTWNGNGEYCHNYCTYTRLKTWRYTENGWFCYKLCVPEYPEVSEMVDGSVLIRVKPISEENLYASENYVSMLGYQGNNVLCSNWDLNHMEELDYNGVYEYLYAMEYGETFNFPENALGIPSDDFETLIMKYFPISYSQIRSFACFDEDNQVYYWERLGCMNYNINYFGTSYPEVMNIRENDDGTITLSVNAVCEMMLNNEAVITHELTIRVNEDGSFYYLGNKILNNGIENIPVYQYRIK